MQELPRGIAQLTNFCFNKTASWWMGKVIIISLLAGGWLILSVSFLLLCSVGSACIGIMGIKSRQHLKFTIFGKERAATQLSSWTHCCTVKCIHCNALLNWVCNTGSTFHLMRNKKGVLQFTVRMQHVLFDFSGKLLKKWFQWL